MESDCIIWKSAANVPSAFGNSVPDLYKPPLGSVTEYETASYWTYAFVEPDIITV